MTVCCQSTANLFDLAQRFRPSEPGVSKDTLYFERKGLRRYNDRNNVRCSINDIQHRVTNSRSLIFIQTVFPSGSVAGVFGITVGKTTDTCQSPRLILGTAQNRPRPLRDSSHFRLEPLSQRSDEHPKHLSPIMSQQS